MEQRGIIAAVERIYVCILIRPFALTEHDGIYQFKAFEDASLEYADDPSVARTERPLGLWDRVLQPGEDIEEVLLDVEAEEAAKAAAVNGGRAKAKKKRKRKKK